MTTTDLSLKVATPEQMVEAWECGVMHGSPSRAREQLQRYPIPNDMVDPTFHQAPYGREGSWSTAKEITNPSAIARMRGWLKHSHMPPLRAPEETEAVWEATLERLTVRTKVENAVRDAIQEVFRNAMDAGIQVAVADYNVAVRNALWTLADDEQEADR